MAFKTYNQETDNITSSELKKIISDNATQANILRNKIEKFEALHHASPTTPTEVKEMVEEPREEKVFDDTDEAFEDEVSFYLSNYKALDENFTPRDMLYVVPSRENYRFKDIIMRMQAESLKDIKDIEEIILEDGESDKLELLAFKQEIQTEKKKMSLLSKLLQEQEIVPTDEKIENKIILVPTRYGNMRLIEELQHISSEYYPRFLELINSIIDGTFKGVQTFTNNDNINRGIFEVKTNKVRIIFSRVGNDTYTLITAFTKKMDTNSHYRDHLEATVSEYRCLHEFFKENCKNEEFMKENESYVKELFQLLTPKQTKKLKKGDSND